MLIHNDDIAKEITEPRYNLAKSKACEIWKNQASQNIPVILNDIIKKFGILVHAAELEIDGISRMDKNGTSLILYKKLTSEVRQRFTVAHELGHIILEHINFNNTSSQFSNNSQEKEANAFAAELLIPKEDLKIFLKSRSKTIDDVIKRY